MKWDVRAFDRELARSILDGQATRRRGRLVRLWDRLWCWWWWLQ